MSNVITICYTIPKQTISTNFAPKQMRPKTKENIMQDTTKKPENQNATDLQTTVMIGKIPQDDQVTLADTGWSATDKERMRAYGYDGIDMLEACYS